MRPAVIPSCLPPGNIPPPVAVTRISGGWTTREIPCCYRKGPVHEGANEGSGESAFVAKCKGRLLPYTGKTPRYIYVAPGVYGKEEALALVLSIDYRTGDPDETYKIELHNPDLGQDDKAYYNIRRNTIYRVFSTLKGTKNMEYDVVVDEWEDTEVAIPW
jgi:hypothetical protein